MKQKTCKICKNKFQPERQMQSVCSYECSLEYGKKHLSNEVKEKKKQDSKAKREFQQNDKVFLKELAQKVFNTYIRMRDGNICISCGFVGDGRKFDCGHYKPRGGFSALAFNENNCSSQCVQCNRFLSANLINYRINLIKKIGIEEVEKLESARHTVKYEIEDYQKIIKKYRLKIKELKL